MVFRWPIEIDGLPINSMVIFHGELLVIIRWYMDYVTPGSQIQDNAD